MARSKSVDSYNMDPFQNVDLMASESQGYHDDGCCDEGVDPATLLALIAGGSF